MAAVIGRRFARLIVVAESGRDPGGRLMVKCRCDCGATILAECYNVKSGHTRSCGCLKREGNRLVHGEARDGKWTPEYNCWLAMKSRCYQPNSISYRYYGPKGVKVCDRWLNSFKNFLADMGRRPSARHSIDRYPNNRGNYEPGNCRWATPTEQSRNRTRTGGWRKKPKLKL